MTDNAAPLPHSRLELPLAEARTRFVQLARLASLTKQVTVVTDGGRPLAAIVPAEGGHSPADRSETVAAGWLRRIETLRDESRRQHAVLEHALEQTWQELDKLKPPGADRDIDALRAAHSIFGREDDR